MIAAFSRCFYLAHFGNDSSHTADYNEFAIGMVLDVGGIVPRNQLISDIPAYLARPMSHY
jgi:hypothetical protein